MSKPTRAQIRDALFAKLQGSWAWQFSAVDEQYIPEEPPAWPALYLMSDDESPEYKDDRTPPIWMRNFVVIAFLRADHAPAVDAMEEALKFSSSDVVYNGWIKPSEQYWTTLAGQVAYARPERIERATISKELGQITVLMNISVRAVG